MGSADIYDQLIDTIEFVKHRPTLSSVSVGRSSELRITESTNNNIERIDEMNLNDLKKSNFLTRKDVGVGALVTIAGVHTANVAKEGAPEELKAVVQFVEFEKPMVLNTTNGQIISRITGIEDDIEIGWVGAKVVIYDDPNVSFGGKLVGGIRVRAPKPGAVAPKPAAVVDDLPF